MLKKTRRIIFVFITIVFLCGSYIAILYAQGYKYNFSDKHFYRTGAVSVKTNDSAEVFLNDKLVGDTSFLSSSFSKGGLLPGQYKIRVQRDNYSSWQKTFSIEEGLVTEFPKVMILPQSETESPKIIAEIDTLMADPKNIDYPTPIPTASPTPSNSPKPSKTPTPTPKPTATPSQFESGQLVYRSGKLLRQTGDSYITLGENVLGFAFSSSNNKALFWTQNDLYVVYLADTDYQPLHKDGDIEKLVHFSGAIAKAVWFRDEDHIVVDSRGYKIVELDSRGGLNIIKL